MGDILSLIEEAERKTDDKKKSTFSKKVHKKAQPYNFEDFRDQLLQINKMGGLMGLAQKITRRTQTFCTGKIR